MKKKLVVAITGSSGSIYAKVLLDKLMQLQAQLEAVGVVLSDNARVNWELEIGPVDFSVYRSGFTKKTTSTRLLPRVRPGMIP